MAVATLGLSVDRQPPFEKSGGAWDRQAVAVSPAVISCCNRHLKRRLRLATVSNGGTCVFLKIFNQSFFLKNINRSFIFFKS
jgi:hypothetical protein